MLPAFCKADVATERVGLTPTVNDRPVPKIISSTFESELVPLRVLDPPGFTLRFVTPAFLITPIPELAPV